jgi:hypothetical protein
LSADRLLALSFPNAPILDRMDKSPFHYNQLKHHKQNIVQFVGPDNRVID